MKARILYGRQVKTCRCIKVPEVSAHYFRGVLNRNITFRIKAKAEIVWDLSQAHANAVALAFED